MKKIRPFTFIPLLAFLLAAFQIQAQDSTRNQEVSVDLGNIIALYPGAGVLYTKSILSNVSFRFRVDAGYTGDKQKLNTNVSISSPYDSFKQDFTDRSNEIVDQLRLRPGVQLEKYFGPVSFYYGADLMFEYTGVSATADEETFSDSNTIRHNVSADLTLNIYRIGILPTAGLRYRFTPHFSLGVEGSVLGSYDIQKVKQNGLQTDTQIATNFQTRQELKETAKGNGYSWGFMPLSLYMGFRF